MHFRLGRPSVNEVRRVIEAQAGQALTYSQVGATAGPVPPGWPARRRAVDVVDGSESEGVAAFQGARRALETWTQYDLGWTDVPVKPPIEPGRDFATLARTLGLWSINCCRIVYVVDEPTRFGYAIGTLPHHAEIGEERFLLTRDGGRVSFEISSFSRANGWFVRLGWPYADHAIRRFVREGTERIRQELQRTVEVR